MSLGDLNFSHYWCDVGCGLTKKELNAYVGGKPRLQHEGGATDHAWRLGLRVVMDYAHNAVARCMSKKAGWNVHFWANVGKGRIDGTMKDGKYILYWSLFCSKWLGRDTIDYCSCKRRIQWQCVTLINAVFRFPRRPKGSDPHKLVPIDIT